MAKIFSFKKIILSLSLLICFFYPEKTFSSDIEMNTAILRTLDKVTGRTNTVQAPVGSEFLFGSLSIKVDVCKTRPPEEPPENSVFLEITDNPLQGEPKLIFSGWMFSSSPALSALDNPAYDIWLIKCTGKKVDQNMNNQTSQMQEKPEIEANPIVKIDTNNPDEFLETETEKQSEGNSEEESEKSSSFFWF